jgi:hypothetical protein
VLLFQISEDPFLRSPDAVGENLFSLRVLVLQDVGDVRPGPPFLVCLSTLFSANFPPNSDRNSTLGIGEGLPERRIESIAFATPLMASSEPNLRAGWAAAPSMGCEVDFNFVVGKVEVIVETEQICDRLWEVR